MQNLYNFERYEPIKINEDMLRLEQKRRELQKQIILLITGAVFCCVCFVLSAFAVAQISLYASVTIIMCFCMYLFGCGFAGVFFYMRRDRRFDII